MKFKYTIIAAVKLQASVTDEAIYYLLETMHENYHIFISASCYATVIKQNVNSVKSIGMRGKASISENLFRLGSVRPKLF